MSDFTGDMTSAVEAAFAAAAPPAADPTPSVESPAPSATATATPDVAAAEPPPTEPPAPAEPGPIPYPRFKEVNEKLGAASKELESLGWAKGVNPQLAQSALQLLTRAQQNPLAFTEELEALRDHPQFGPQLRSWAARTLGTRAPRQEPSPEPDRPMPDLEFEDGRKAYSADQIEKRDEWLLKQWEAKLNERLAPLTQKTAANEQFVAEQVYGSIKARAATEAQAEIETLKQQYPQFWDHKDEVAAVMDANPTYTLKQAWAEVFINTVGPKLAEQSAASVKQKVLAGSANPARPSGAPPAPPQDFEEALRQLLSK